MPIQDMQHGTPLQDDAGGYSFEREYPLFKWHGSRDADKQGAFGNGGLVMTLTRNGELDHPALEDFPLDAGVLWQKLAWQPDNDTALEFVSITGGFDLAVVARRLNWYIGYLGSNNKERKKWLVSRDENQRQIYYSKENVESLFTDDMGNPRLVGRNYLLGILGGDGSNNRAITNWHLRHMTLVEVAFEGTAGVIVAGRDGLMKQFQDAVQKPIQEHLGLENMHQHTLYIPFKVSKVQVNDYDRKMYYPELPDFGGASLEELIERLYVGDDLMDMVTASTLGQDSLLKRADEWRRISIYDRINANKDAASVDDPYTYGEGSIPDPELDADFATATTKKMAF